MQPTTEVKKVTIGYFNTVIDQEWAVIPMKGALATARDLDVKLMSFCGQMIRDEKDCLGQANIIYELAMKGAIDGAIIWDGNFTQNLTDAEIAEFCDRLGVPVVNIGMLPGLTGIAYDNYAIMKVAINHLLEVHGIDRIGYLGIATNHVAFRERFYAYRDVLAEHGFAYDESIISPLNQWESLNDGGKTNSAVEDWLRRSFDSGMRGLVASCDPTAAWVLDRLHHIGIKVPNDIAVVGFDGFMQGRTAFPRLSSVRPAWEELGSLAVETIFKKIKGDSVPPINFISSDFLISQSCGCIDRNVIETAQANPDNGYALNSSSMTALEDALRCDVSESAGYHFITVLNEILNEALRSKQDIIQWQSAITVIRNAMLTNDPEMSVKNKVELLCNQARVAIGNAVEMQNSRVLYDLNDWQVFENELFRNLASTFDIAKIAEMLFQKLPQLGIPECYLSIYENPVPYKYPDPAPEWSRLVLAYGGREVKRFEGEGLLFRSCEIIPSELGIPDNSRTLLALPLYFENTQIGFIVFGVEKELLNGTTYTLLASQISASIRGTFLIDEIMRTTRMLTENQRKLVASEKMASLGRLTAGIAHELNTPLAAVRNSLEILKDLINEYANSINDPQVQSEDHRAIAADMQKLVLSSLVSAEKSAGFIRGIKGQTMNLITRPAAYFAAAPVVTDTLLLLNFALQRGGCELVTDIQKDVELYGDPHELGQIITNFVNNAIDACAPGAGKIIVSLKNAKTGGTVLSVADNGSGISSENLSKIFDPMFTTKPFGVGTGLGLTIVHELVEKFRGHLDVASEPGNTVFSVVFPVIGKE